MEEKIWWNKLFFFKLFPYSFLSNSVVSSTHQLVLEPGLIMETRTKTNTEFRNEVNETLAHHEAGIDQANNNITQANHNIDQMNATLLTVVTELQALRHAHTQNSTEREVSPFFQAETSTHRNSNPPDFNPSTQPVIRNPSQTDTFQSTQIADRNYTQLKLSFPRFNGLDPTGWLYIAEQYLIST